MFSQIFLRIINFWELKNTYDDFYLYSIILQMFIITIIFVTVVSKIAKPKAQSEDRELPTKPADNSTVRLQQIGVEPSPVNIFFTLT